jgi:hypothetical protein
MKVSKMDSYFNSAAYLQKKSKKKPDPRSPDEKENIPYHGNYAMNSITSSKRFGEQKPGSPLRDATNYKPQSPSNGSSRGSLNRHYPCYTNGSIKRPSANEERQRSLTPKSLKELLMEKKKTLSFSPVGGKPAYPKMQIVAKSGSESLGKDSLSKAQGNAQNEKLGRVAYNSVSSRGSPGGKEAPQAPLCPGSPTTNDPGFLLNALKNENSLSNKCGLLVTSNCINHPEKRSKFYVVEDRRVVELDESLDFLRGICSKCAVRLANMGFKIEEMEDADALGEEKAHTFHLFIKYVNNIRKLNGSALGIVESKQQSLHDFYRDQLEAIYSLETMVKVLMCRMRDGLAQLKQQVEEQSRSELQKFEDIKGLLAGNDGDLANFLANLQDNFNDTINNIDMATLQANIANFEQQLETLVKSSKQSTQTSISVLRVSEPSAGAIKDLEKRIDLLFKPVPSSLQIESNRHYADYQFLLDQFDRQDKSRIINSSVIDHTGLASPNNPPENNVYLSFENQELHNSVLSDEEVNNGRENLLQSSTQNYFSVLDKISESQNEKNDFYNSLIYKESDPLFILTPTEADFAHKQTPELGQKDYIPDHLKEQLKELHMQVEQVSMVKKSNANAMADDGTKSDLSDMDELFNFIGKKEESGSGINKCQKILFSEDQ